MLSSPPQLGFNVVAYFNKTNCFGFSMKLFPKKKGMLWKRGSKVYGWVKGLYFDDGNSLWI